MISGSKEALTPLTCERTTLTVAHRMGSLKEVERRLYFEAGRLAGDGLHEELIAAGPGYAELVCSEPSEWIE